MSLNVFYFFVLLNPPRWAILRSIPTGILPHPPTPSAPADSVLCTRILPSTLWRIRTRRRRGERSASEYLSILLTPKTGTQKYSSILLTPETGTQKYSSILLTDENRYSKILEYFTHAQTAVLKSTQIFLSTFEYRFLHIFVFKFDYDIFRHSWVSEVHITNICVNLKWFIYTHNVENIRESTIMYSVVESMKAYRWTITRKGAKNQHIRRRWASHHFKPVLL